jgi:hypothetical protein
MRSYWTCSKFADWIRGTKKPTSASEAGWVNWRMIARASHPVRFWIADVGLDKVQKFIYYIPTKVHDVECYIDNRFVSKTHALVAHKSHLKRGRWRDVDDRILPCLFDTLVDFVETELAAAIFWHNESYKVPFRYKLPFMHWRSREAGIENLNWQMALVYDENSGVDKTDPKYGTPTQQAIKAAEVLELYLWWKDVYPNRPDPMKVSGFHDYCEEKRKVAASKTTDKRCIMWSVLDDSDVSQELQEKGHEALKILNQLEEQYEKEDEEMMIRLIKVRHKLWT